MKTASSARYTFAALRTLPWAQIIGTDLASVSSKYRMREVEIQHPTFSTAIVCQCGSNPASMRRIVLDPAQKDQVRAQGYC